MPGSLIPPSKPDRAKLINRFHGVEVYQVERVTIAWKFSTPWNTTVSGRAEQGRAMLTPTHDMVKIYLSKDSANIRCPPFELMAELRMYFGIDSPESCSHLWNIFLVNDPDEAERLMDKDGIPNDKDVLSEDSASDDGTVGPVNGIRRAGASAASIGKASERHPKRRDSHVHPHNMHRIERASRPHGNRPSSLLSETASREAKSASLANIGRRKRDIPQGDNRSLSSSLSRNPTIRTADRTEKIPITKDSKAEDGDDSSEDDSDHGSELLPYKHPKEDRNYVPPSRRVHNPRPRARDRGVMSLSTNLPRLPENYQDEEGQAFAEYIACLAPLSSAPLPIPCS